MAATVNWLRIGFEYFRAKLELFLALKRGVEGNRILLAAV